MIYDFGKIEKKWQKKWEENNIFEAKEDSKKRKFYVLDMFPYPSGLGLHMGHAFVYSLGDIFARFKRMQGFNVFYPIGYDGLGLPAENAAIKEKIHPQDYNRKSIQNFMKQQKAMGWSYDWSRVLRTDVPEYYGWDQWIFLKMLEKGIAYRKKAPVNWCSKCETVLANEQVVNGKCWRHGEVEVKIKHLEQWFFRTTKYAEDLLKGLEKVDWPERAKAMQRHWIGKSNGTEILFEVNGKKWPIFTTRPDTIFGVTFIVISAQHPKLEDLITKEQRSDVNKFLKKVNSVSEKDLIDLEKEGVFTGNYAINPINNERIPIYVGNFVLADYAGGMVMAVPAHDQRDFDFAKKYKIKIRQVIEGEITNSEAYMGSGNLINSGKFDGLENVKAKEEITKFLLKKKLGKKVIQYKLRDWLISRQRYWGTPIPIIYCDRCGIVSVPEKDLPVELPKDVKFGKGNPLLTNEKWLNVKCPKCKGDAKRESDTMDTFVNSSWYYMRYCDPKNLKKIFDEKRVKYWCPIDQYIGGPEHITAHLIYSRFYTKFFKDLGLINFDEPARRYFTQGIVHGKDGDKMSKSKGNIVEPLEMIEKYGADTLRLAIVSFASPENDSIWNEKIVVGSHKFLKKVYDYFGKVNIGKSDAKTENKLNKSIKEITSDIENFKYNLAVIKIRALFESLPLETSKEILEKSIKLLAPFCPHFAEEIWEKLKGKGFVSLASWSEADEKKINEDLDKAEEMVERLVRDINNVVNIVCKNVGKVFVYCMPNELKIYEGELETIKKKTNLNINVYAVNDKEKLDPEGKAKKAKHGKPAIYLE
jgi:leucyl-tRNA synthetase